MLEGAGALGVCVGESQFQKKREERRRKKEAEGKPPQAKVWR